jgi:hypothetical protein
MKPPSSRALLNPGTLLFLAFASTATLGRATANMPAVSATELVQRTAQNEIRSNNQALRYMFRDRKETPHGSQTKLMVETQEAMAGMLVAIDDRPLNPQQREAEIARIQRFIGDPEELRKKHKQEKEDAERITRIMSALPQAFLYEFDGTDVGSPGIGKPGIELVRLKFRPNPHYTPPSHVEQVLTGMQGMMLIDPHKNRIAKIDGTLVKDVSFGWGILGHLDRGGHFLVEQGDIGEDHWEITRMDLSFTGKIMLFKGVSIKSTEVYTDFHPVPADLTFAQGVELLKRREATLAENQRGDKDKDEEPK